MADHRSSSTTSATDALNERLATELQGNWLHNFRIDEDGQVIFAESYAYRRRILQAVFASLFCDRAICVLDERSGVYSALIHRAGARRVTASSGSARTCELIADVTEHLQTPVIVVQSKMAAFYENEPYVDQAHGDAFDFVLALGLVWPMFGAAGEDFDAVVEALAFFVVDGLVFDWTDAEWATPGPPEHYNIRAFCDALRRKFEYVTVYGDWLVTAVGKLPAPEADAGASVGTAEGQEQPTGQPEPTAYETVVRRFREAVARSSPEGATIAVVSKGDAALLQIGGRVAWHLPQDDAGVYTGSHPASSADAIAGLDELRRRGARYVAFPAHTAWWLDHYVEFASYLRDNGRLILEEQSVALVFQVDPLEGDEDV